VDNELLAERIYQALNLDWTVSPIRAALGLPPIKTEEEVTLEARFETAQDVEACLDIADEAPTGSRVRQRALERADTLLDRQLDQAVTTEDCLVVHHKAREMGGSVKDRSLERALQLIKTAEQAWKVFRTAGDSDRATQEKALDAIALVATKIKDFREVLECTEPHLPRAYACIRKVGEILKAEAEATPVTTG
jgi:hypothetical protein